ncbi:MAG: hypothetical protein JXA28_01710 [Bacteroidetes bacterium]|nr:hypothetical protein [Bacteroidota bacterium]
MSLHTAHSFHIPVLGVGYSVDTPLKVAKYGISSVMSIVDDALLERLRAHYLGQRGERYDPIADQDMDARARRVTAYLDMIDVMVREQVEEMERDGFAPDSDLHRYFEMLPEYSDQKALYRIMSASEDETLIAQLQQQLLAAIVPGSIDVNIMTKVDKANADREGNILPVEYNDAHAALRGFANSTLESSVVFSAGMNPRLYSYAATFDAFRPRPDGTFPKRIVIKVSDFRSALIQGKFLAKKGLWVSEYRIESGLNCGGHAFATDGLLLGPILEEFRSKRAELIETVGAILVPALHARGIDVDLSALPLQVTVQGGVGKAEEHEFLRRHYAVNSVGWGSPFLLVPEATNVDDDTLEKLCRAGEEDIYLSEVSPLGVPFNNLRDNAKDAEKAERAAVGKPGSPCKKKFLSFNTEYSEKPVCTASTTYINRKLRDLREKYLQPEEFRAAYERIVDKACLCEGLIASALSKHSLSLYKQSMAAAVCPGPNLAYFSKCVSLREMVDHIYGRIHLMTDNSRPNMFLKELGLYIDHFQKKMDEHARQGSTHTEAFFSTFYENLAEGIAYYRELIPHIAEEAEHVRERMKNELAVLEERLHACAVVPA